MCFFLSDPLSIVVRMRRDSITYSIRPSRHNRLLLRCLRGGQQLRGRHVTFSRKSQESPTMIAFPCWRSDFLASRSCLSCLSCLSGYLRLVAWSTIDCIWTGKVVLHMSRLSTSFIRLTLKIDAVAFMKTFDSRSDGQSSSYVDLLLLSCYTELYI